MYVICSVCKPEILEHVQVGANTDKDVILTRKNYFRPWVI